MLGVGLLGTWMSLALVHRDTGPRFWRLEQELAGLSKDLGDDCWLEMLEWRRDWLLWGREQQVGRALGCWGGHSGARGRLCNSVIWVLKKILHTPLLGTQSKRHAQLIPKGY